MSILIDSKTKVIVQGITGQHGSFHAEQMLQYGTNVVSGVTPGKGGQTFKAKIDKWDKEIPVFDSVKEAQEFSAAAFSILFVPARFALGAAMESLKENLNIVIITEQIPVHEAMLIMKEAEKRGLTVIGPNCPGIITPGECKIGIMPGHIFKRGKIGVLSRSGTLTYEIVQQMSEHGFGQSTVIGVGGDMVRGTSFVHGLKMFENDDETDAVVLIGEIGGEAEERAAEYIKENVKKPVLAYIAGKTAPKEKMMGHAGAIIIGNRGTFEVKKSAFEKVGVKVATFPSDVPLFLAELFTG